jgi:hypothetical protein
MLPINFKPHLVSDVHLRMTYTALFGLVYDFERLEMAID